MEEEGGARPAARVMSQHVTYAFSLSSWVTSLLSQTKGQGENLGANCRYTTSRAVQTFDTFIFQIPHYVLPHVSCNNFL